MGQSVKLWETKWAWQLLPFCRIQKKKFITLEWAFLLSAVEQHTRSQRGGKAQAAAMEKHHGAGWTLIK